MQTNRLAKHPIAGADNAAWLLHPLTALICAAALSGAAQIPTTAERWAESAMNTNYCTGRAAAIQAAASVRPDKKQPPVPIGFRKDFTLSAPVRAARITVFPAGIEGYSVCVNGKEALAPAPARVQGYRTVDIAACLRPGSNSFVLRGHSIPGSVVSLVAQGMVYGANGSIFDLVTDASWRGGYNPPDGWDQPATALEALPAVRAVKYFWTYGIPINPPYDEPIRVTPQKTSDPIFESEMPIALDIRIMNAAGLAEDSARLQLKYDLFDENARRVIQPETGIKLTPDGKLDLAGALSHPGLPPGAYQLRFNLGDSSGEMIYTRIFEIAVVGEIPQVLVQGTNFTDGMELKEVGSIDCGADPAPGDFLAFRGDDVIETTVTNSPIGRYRTFADNTRYNYMTWKYRIKTLYIPHVVEVEYPDDAPRSTCIQIFEPGTTIPGALKAKEYGFQRADAGLTSPREHPTHTGAMRKTHLLYWPNEEQACISFLNLASEAPAAVSRITFYEVLNDLPALRIREPQADTLPGGRHLIGYHSERGPQTMANNFYTGPLGNLFALSLGMNNHIEFYRNWHATTENMIKFMRFAGQNMYLMGHYMYGSTLYPTKRFVYSQNTYQSGDGALDYGALMLRMFERNGMKLISNIQFGCTKEHRMPTVEEIARGEKPWALVSREGRPGGWGRDNTWLNWMHPQPQDDLLTVIDELLELYAHYQAYQGICLLLSRQFAGPMIHCPWVGETGDPLDWGYEDYTIALFEQETGINVPGDADDPTRFKKRYDWLTANAREQWIDWRCARITALFGKIRDKIVQARPDLMLYIINAEPFYDWSSGPTRQGVQLQGKYNDAAAHEEVFKAFGLDFRALKHSPNISLCNMYRSPGANGPLWSPWRTWSDANLSEPLHDFFANDARGGAYVWCGIYHSGFAFTKHDWMFKFTYSRQGYLWPILFKDMWINAMIRSNPAWIPHTWMDVAQSAGRLQELREFSRIYRTLPNGIYRRLTGNGLDKNIWVSSMSAPGGEYAYAANPAWWTTDVTLEFDPGTVVHDLIEDKPVQLENDAWKFRLEPFDAKTFKITIPTGRPPDGSALRTAESIVPAAAEKIIRQDIEKNDRLTEDLLRQARAKEERLRKTPGWRRVGDLETMLAGIQSDRAAGNIAAAHEKAISWELEQARNQVKHESLEVIPFLVLGPFGREADTKSDTRKGDVVNGFKGMETAFIDETGAPDCNLKHEVYPGVLKGWKKTDKTYWLSFMPLAGSPEPYWMVAYAYTEVYAPRELQAILHVGSDHAIAVRLNGEEVLRHGGHGTPRGGQRPSSPRQDSARINLRQGWNSVFIKAVQRGATRVFFEITDAAGNPVPDLEYRVPAIAQG